MHPHLSVMLCYRGICCCRVSVRLSVCQSVCLSVRLSQAGTVPKRLKRRITQTALYDNPRILVCEIPTASPPTGAPNRDGVVQIGDF